MYGSVYDTTYFTYILNVYICIALFDSCIHAGRPGSKMSLFKEYWYGFFFWVDHHMYPQGGNPTAATRPTDRSYNYLQV